MNKLSDRVIADLNDLLQRTYAKRGALESDMAALGVITEEYHEVIDAMRQGEWWKIRAELLDLANGCIRRVLAVDGEQAQEQKPVAEEPAVVADPETLEELGKIAFNTFYTSENKSEWDEFFASCCDKWTDAVVAILRAARPMLDMPRHEIAEAVNSRMSTEAVMEQIDRRIRYRVEVPTAECPTCARVRKALEGCSDE